MKFKPVHHNHNVADMAKSIAFYERALGLHEVRRKQAEDDSFTIVFLGAEGSDMQIELTALREHPDTYALGENEQHIGFFVDDYAAAYKLHSEMGCICYENPDMGIYFITDPDGYWLEVIPEK
ncbi:MAG: VOC family protein [Christensenellaceae bacterium]|jgi:lactoylglutathione lyase|nr:VOC family protein [Christensenellaceae bacterium]